MSLPVFFRRPARAEFIEAAAWYEGRQPGLGAAFITEIDRCVTLAVQQPLLFAVVHNDVRRVVAERFPYSVDYRVESRRTVAFAVLHASRDPSVWRQRG